MPPGTVFLQSDRKLRLLLFVCSFAIYSIYFFPVFLNLNSILSSITLDSIKNYYTFAYHVRNDAGLLNFSGMNYPFGEHVVYSDCQPLLGTVLKLLPFTEPYLIGILHACMFLSFIVSPLVLFRIFSLLNVDRICSFLFSIGIALLAPQFVKLHAGHFSLAYGFVIPLSMLLILKAMLHKGLWRHLILLTYSFLLFFLHPYLGFGVSVFVFFSLLLHQLFQNKGKERIRGLVLALGTGLLPVILFKLFMLVTDHHAGRTEEPYGLDVMVENMSTLLASDTGPLGNLFRGVLPAATTHFEGHSYLGMSSILLLLIYFGVLLTRIKKLRSNALTLCLFVSSLVLLTIAFGWHRLLLSVLNIDSPSLNQFRAVSRFAYFFYYGLPVFMISSLYHFFSIEGTVRIRKLRIVSAALFLLTLFEAHYFFTKDKEVYWKYRNIFNAALLNEEEKSLLAQLERVKAQAIMPLPVFHGGSEVYERSGSNSSYIPSMLYSYHSGLPVFSVLMSRTSISETEEALDILNTYKRFRPGLARIGSTPFFVIKTKDPLLPDEERLLRRTNLFASQDSLAFGLLQKKALLTPVLDSIQYMIDTIPRKNVIFFHAQLRKPFITANMNDYEKLHVIEPGTIESGEYILSFHHHYSGRTYKALACNLIVTETRGSQLEWKYNVPVRLLSGFYKGFGVFEYPVNLSASNKYEFLLKGFIDQTYRVSDFMLRPANVTLRHGAEKGGVSSINNFPEE